MLSRRSHYPFRSHDLPMTSDLFASQKSPISSQPQVLDSYPKNVMPSLVSHSENPTINFQYNDNDYPEDELFDSPDTLVDWEDYHDPATFFEDPHQCHISQSRLEGVSAVDNPVDQNMWTYDALQTPLEAVYSSSIFPRTFPSQEDAVIKEMMQSKLHYHHVSPYIEEPQNRQTHSHLQQANHNNLMESPREPPLSLEVKLFKPEIPMPDNVKVETLERDRLNTIRRRTNDSPTPTIGNDESDADSSITEPYAQLICRALKSVPGYGMVLKDIYDWFEKNTDKAKNTSSKGWQNSIRHNLSMNGAFKKVEQTTPTEESKKGFIWVLEQSALEEGVKSTTRYRKFSSNKKSCKGETPAPQRQRSGSKGGKAARKAAKSRRSARFEELRPFRYHERLPIGPGTASIIDDNDHSKNTFFSPERMPYYLHTPHPPTTPVMPEKISYTFSDITGCASRAPNDPLFYDSLDAGTDSTLSCHSFSDNLLNCGLGCME